MNGLLDEYGLSLPSRFLAVRRRALVVVLCVTVPQGSRDIRDCSRVGDLLVHTRPKHCVR